VATTAINQNALAERINGILKGKLLLQRSANLEQTRRMLREWIQIYNAERPRLSLKMQTPDAVHRASLAGICRLESPFQVST
jgi:putative transposase